MSVGELANSLSTWTLASASRVYSSTPSDPPCHVAWCTAFDGHVEAIRALVELGACRGAQTNYGGTARQLTLRLNHHEAARVLKAL